MAKPASFEEEDHHGSSSVIPHLTAAELKEKQRTDTCIGAVINQMESEEKPPPSLRKELPELMAYCTGKDRKVHSCLTNLCCQKSSDV